MMWVDFAFKRALLNKSEIRRDFQFIQQRPTNAGAFLSFSGAVALLT